MRNLTRSRSNRFHRKKMNRDTEKKYLITFLPREEVYSSLIDNKLETFKHAELRVLLRYDERQKKKETYSVYKFN